MKSCGLLKRERKEMWKYVELGCGVRWGRGEDVVGWDYCNFCYWCGGRCLF